jgi:hypothetical protein
MARLERGDFFLESVSFRTGRCRLTRIAAARMIGVSNTSTTTVAATLRSCRGSRRGRGCMTERAEVSRRPASPHFGNVHDSPVNEDGGTISIDDALVPGCVFPPKFVEDAPGREWPLHLAPDLGGGDAARHLVRGLGGQAQKYPATARPAAAARDNPPDPITSLLSRGGSARAFLDERAGLRDLRPDRIGILRERDRRDVMRTRLAGITRFLCVRRGPEAPFSFSLHHGLKCKKRATFIRSERRSWRRSLSERSLKITDQICWPWRALGAT